MKNKILFLIIMITLGLYSVGCGSEVGVTSTETVSSETNTPTHEPEEEKGADEDDLNQIDSEVVNDSENTSDSKILVQKEYRYGENGALKVGLYEDGSLFFSAEGLTEEEAAAMLVLINSLFKGNEIDFSVFAAVEGGQLYAGVKQKGDLYYAFGAERNGATSLVIPTWVDEICTEEFVSGEKFNGLSQELLYVIGEFIN